MYQTVFHMNFPPEEDSEDEEERAHYTMRMSELWPRIFTVIDRDNNHYVDSAELMRIHKSCKGAQRIINMMEISDKDSDHKVTESEWAQMLDAMIEKHGEPDEKTFNSCLEVYKDIVRFTFPVEGAISIFKPSHLD